MLQEKNIAEFIEKEKNNLNFNPETVDLEAFLKDILELRKEIDANLGEEDIKHLKKIDSIGRVSTILGLLTAGLPPNLFSSFALSLGRSTQWLLMHHIGHRGYDRVPNVPKYYHSNHFAKGARRFIDWCDWMTPEAWKYEHNVLHHSHTGEAKDPDIVERNVEILRNSNLPEPIKFAILCVLGMGWKPLYYTPNTTQAWHDRFDAEAKEEIKGIDVNFKEIGKDLVLKSYLPYALLTFGTLPLIFLPFGTGAVFNAFCNSLIAELMTNFHTFFVVGPNHTGDDIYRFNSKPKNKAERFLRQVIGSVNYRTGKDLNDYAHLWLNYQIEHHIYPDIPMLKYQQFQPKIKAMCEKHGVPYIQESVFTRFRKMSDVVVGKATMPQLF